MVAPSAFRERTQSLGEEIANSVSHGAGLVAAVVAVPVLVVAAIHRGDPWGIAAAAVFATTMVLVYLLSTLYHAVPGNRAKRVLRVLDHAAIFLLIAGTYTPFTLGVLRGGWGWTLLGLVWGLGLAGVALKIVSGARYPMFSLCLYLATGWVALIAVKPIWLAVPAGGLFWIMAGGLAYTAGVPFFAVERFRYSHFVWHLFVIAGSACHFMAVLRYAA